MNKGSNYNYMQYPTGVEFAAGTHDSYGLFKELRGTINVWFITKNIFEAPWNILLVYLRIWRFEKDILKVNPFRCVHMLNNIYNKLQYSKIRIFCHKFCDITRFFLKKISKKRSTIRIMYINLNRITDL